MVQLKVFLIRQELTQFGDILDEGIAADEIELDPELGWDGLLLVKKMVPKEPEWTKTISPIVRSRLAGIRTSSSASVLLLRTGGRVLAFTFGYGRSLLRPDTHERDFGLRVALNTVDPQALRSIDMQTIEDLTVSTRRQTSRATDFGAFALDSSQDLLRGVTGVPRDPAFASRVSGSEALMISAHLDIRALPLKCDRVLDAYGKNDYRERFGFIDHVRIARDRVLREKLDELLVADLAAHNLGTVHLGPAGPEDWENISGFTYSRGLRAEVYPDLDIEDALRELRQGKVITPQYLHNRPVGVRYRDAETSVDRYSLYSCIVYEREMDGKLYMLSAGDWHEVEWSWAQGVRRRVRSLPKPGVPLPPSRAGERESDYNARTAKSEGWALMDNNIISLAPPHDRVEMCDLLTPNGQLIHVKRKTVSATLSHLFAQGRVSGELLFRSEDFRKECKEKAGAKCSAWAAWVPVGRPVPGSFEVIYAILARTSSEWPNSLPFFSQLNLDNAARSLEQLGYRVSLGHIPADPHS